MGVDFTHCDAHWSYSGFNRFRAKLVAALGSHEGIREMYSQPVECWPPAVLDSPLLPLINHSDCDGELSVEEMEQVVPVLEKILSLWHEGDFDRVQGEMFLQGMKDAIEAGEPLGFH